MYRVELKAQRGGQQEKAFSLLFLMYRVELKEGPAREPKAEGTKFLMYRVELKA